MSRTAESRSTREPSFAYPKMYRVRQVADERPEGKTDWPRHCRAGRIGLMRGEVAARHGQVEWIGIAGKNPDRARFVKETVGADFVTQDYRELLRRSEVTATVVGTDEHLHADPILLAAQQKQALFVEKPLATELSDSARILTTIQQSGVDAVVAYTQRFCRRCTCNRAV